MFANPPFPLLNNRAELQEAARRLLNPLLPFFNVHQSGITLGPEIGVQGEPIASLEAFSRALWGLVPLVAGGGDFPNVARWRNAMLAGTNPDHAGYWGDVRGFDQRQVEQPAIALALALAPQTFWDPLTVAERAQVTNWLRQTNAVGIVDSNWRWFRVLVNAVLRHLGEEWDADILASDLKRIDEFYLGEGWYRDENRVGDYYIPMAMHFYGLLFAKLSDRFDPESARRYRERSRIFAQDFACWFAADGSAIPIGRSLIYRFAQGCFWGALALADEEALPWGEIKGLLLRHLRWWFRQPIFSETGLLTIGYRFPNPGIGEGYNAYGSPYWALKAFLPLSLPENHPFWQAEELPAPAARASVSVQENAGLLLCHDEASGHVFALNRGQTLEDWPRHCAHKYGKLAYSSTFGVGIAIGAQAGAAGMDCTLALSDDGGKTYRLREKCTELEFSGTTLVSTWRPWADVEVRTWLAPALPGHLRVHRIRSEREISSADGGFAIDCHAAGFEKFSPTSSGVAAKNAQMGSAIFDLFGDRCGEIQPQETWSHLLWFYAAFPVLFGKHAAGETWLVSYVAGQPGEYTAADFAGDAAGWSVELNDGKWHINRRGVPLLTLTS